MNPHQDLLVQTLHRLSHLSDVNTIDYSFKLLMMITTVTDPDLERGGGGGRS